MLGRKWEAEKRQFNVIPSSSGYFFLMVFPRQVSPVRPHPHIHSVTSPFRTMQTSPDAWMQLLTTYTRLQCWLVTMACSQKGKCLQSRDCDGEKWPQWKRNTVVCRIKELLLFTNGKPKRGVNGEKAAERKDFTLFHPMWKPWHLWRNWC